MKLYPDEIICDQCNGVGHYGYSVERIEFINNGIIQHMPGIKTYDYCTKCKGVGKLDWIEAIVGKRDLNQ